MDDSRSTDSGTGTQRAPGAAAALQAAAPLLIQTLQEKWTTPEGIQVRQVLWSLYTASHLVNLGRACAGLDQALADALIAAIAAHLVLGPEAEPLFDHILRDSGEIARFEEAARATPEHLPVIYPEFPLGPPALRQIADALEYSEALQRRL